MKIMIYYLAMFVSNPSPVQREHSTAFAAAKLKELQLEFPGIRIKVIAAFGADHDHVDMLDFSYPQTFYNLNTGAALGPVYPYNNPNVPGNTGAGGGGGYTYTYTTTIVAGDYEKTTTPNMDSPK